MKIKTKFLIALGTPIAAITPVVAVVSCGTSSSMAGNENAITKEEVAAYKAELKAWQDDFAAYPWAKTAIKEKYVDEEAFFNVDLTQVTTKTGGEFYLPKFIESIGDGAFQNAKLNQHFKLVDTETAKTGYPSWRGVKSIGQQAFKNVDFTKLDKDPRVQDFLPSSVWTIENEGFSSSILNDGFKIKDSIIEMGSDVFAGATISKGFEFKPDMNSLSDGTFSSAKLSGPLVLPDKIHVIGERAFQGVDFTTNKNGEKRNLTFSNEIYKIKSEAFEGAKFDYLFVIPDTVQDMQEKAFAQAELPEGIQIGTNKSRLSVISIEAFNGAQIGNTFDITNAPDISIIDDKAFVSAKIPNSFKLPAKLKSIGSKAFQGVDFTGLTDKGTFLYNAQGKYTIEKLSPSSFQGVKIDSGFRLWGPESKLTSQILGQAFVSVVFPDGQDWSEQDTTGPKPGAVVQ